MLLLSTIIQVTESHLLSMETDIGIHRWTISLLCNDDLHQIAILRLGMVQLVAVEYQHEVSVVFQEPAARLREPGSLERASIHSLEQLSDYQHRNIDNDEGHMLLLD